MIDAMLGLRIKDVRTHPVVVPISRPLKTASGSIPQAPLLLIDLHTDEGVTGRSYLFAYHAFALKPLDDLVKALAELLVGEEVAPLPMQQKLRAQLTLLGSTGLSGMAVSGLEMAGWDALAAGLGVPLVTLLGGCPSSLRTYDSLGMLRPEEAGRQAGRAVDEGFEAIKIKIGWPSRADDINAVRTVRAQVPDGFALMVDFNQSLSVNEALARCRALDEEGVYWIEEPIRADDFRGTARIAFEARTPIQIGENLSGPTELTAALEARACDYVMSDVSRIGGVSGWLEAASMAAAAGIDCSSHLYPEISAHLLAVAPSAHWLEYLDLAGPVLKEPITVSSGRVTIPNRPGVGLDWDPAAVARFRLA